MSIVSPTPLTAVVGAKAMELDGTSLPSFTLKTAHDSSTLPSLANISSARRLFHSTDAVEQERLRKVKSLYKGASVAPTTIGSRAGCTAHNTLNDKDWADLFATVGYGEPEDPVLGPYPFLYDMQAIHFKDIAGSSSTDFVSDADTFLVEYGYTGHDIAIAPEYQLQGTAATEVLFTFSNHKDPLSRAAALALLAEVVTARGSLSTVRCVNTDGTIATCRPLIHLPTNAAATATFSFVREQSRMAASPTASKLNTQGKSTGSAAKDCFQHIAYARAAILKAGGRSSLSHPVAVLCSSIVSASTTTDHKITLTFVDADSKTVATSSGQVTFTTPKARFSLIPAADSRISGLDTKGGIVMSTTSPSHRDAATALAKLGKAVQEQFDFPVSLKPTSAGQEPMEASQLTDATVRYYTADINHNSIASSKPTEGKDGRFLFTFYPDNAASRAACTYVAAWLAATGHPILDSAAAGRAITFNAHRTSHVGRLEGSIGTTSNNGPVLKKGQLHAASLAMAEAHTTLGLQPSRNLAQQFMAGLQHHLPHDKESGARDHSMGVKSSSSTPLGSVLSMVPTLIKGMRGVLVAEASTRTQLEQQLRESLEAMAPYVKRPAAAPAGQALAQPGPKQPPKQGGRPDRRQQQAPQPPATATVVATAMTDASAPPGAGPTAPSGAPPVAPPVRWGPGMDLSNIVQLSPPARQRAAKRHTSARSVASRSLSYGGTSASKEDGELPNMAD